MITPSDLSQLNERGITLVALEEQLHFFKNGFPWLELKGAASVDNGILKISEADADHYIQAWRTYLSDSKKRIVKFVPASGAASRMFKDLYEFIDGEENTPNSPFMNKFFSEITKFAFYSDLDTTCFVLYSLGIESLIAGKRYKDIVNALLSKEGLNYGNLPKGLLQFHSYTNTSRTPMEEHLCEGALYASSNSKRVNIHFTVSKEHKQLFNDLLDKKQHIYEQIFGCQFNVSFSEQKPSTDTVAADENNEPFRDEEGKIIFRPGGHGALIENLNDIDADVIFIKNIDNVVPDHFKDSTTQYKRIIAGVLVSLQLQIDNYLEKLCSGNYTTDDLHEMIKFVQHQLFVRNPELKFLEDAELAIYLKHKLNRPLRVCGMVKNEGEPGGGPFWVTNPDGTFSLQILESSQIDISDPTKRAMMENATHFNPVDLVCSVRSFTGEKFDLTKHVDKNCGFITYKSKGGKALKALELPGLWNGAMSDWNTVFVEVPIETFNPVKTVNDLLRKEHQ